MPFQQAAWGVSLGDPLARDLALVIAPRFANRALYHRALTATYEHRGLIAPASGIAHGPSLSQGARGYLISSSSDYIGSNTEAGSDGPTLEIASGSSFTVQFVIDRVVNAPALNAGFFRTGSGETGGTFFIGGEAGYARSSPWVRLNSSDILTPNTVEWVAGKTLNIIVRVVSGSSVDVWWDGVQKRSASHAVAVPDLTGTNGIYHFGRQGGAEQRGGNFTLIQAWRRALHDAEMRVVAARPWQLVQRTRRRSWVPGAAAAGITGPLIGRGRLLNSPLISGRLVQ